MLQSFFAPVVGGDQSDKSEEEDSVTGDNPALPLVNGTSTNVFNDDDIQYIDPPDVDANLLSEEEEEEHGQYIGFEADSCVNC